MGRGGSQTRPYKDTHAARKATTGGCPYKTSDRTRGVGLRVCVGAGLRPAPTGRRGNIACVGGGALETKMQNTRMHCVVKSRHKGGKPRIEANLWD